MKVFDVETDGLLDELTKVHTLHVLETETGERLRFNDGFFADGTPAPRDGSIVDGLKLLMTTDGVIGHNIIAFDIPAITKVYPWFRLFCPVHDTLVYARLIYPHIKLIDSAAMKKGKRPIEFTGKLVGAHSLKAWGMRLGCLKADYEGEWHSFTQEMEQYAAQDPVTTFALWELVINKEYAPEAVRLEHDVAEIIFLQERFGFLFDRAGAEKLEIELRGRKAELEDRLRETFRPWFKPERKHGQVVVMTPKRNDRARHYTVDAPFSKIKLVSFNPASREQIGDRLKELYQWIPVEFTEGGQPKVDETTLGSLDHIPAARLLVDYLTVDKRLGQLADGKQAWLKKVRENGRIHGRVNTLGAITRRMTHSDPNVAQVPSLINAKGVVPYGRECRSLFIVRHGFKLCGCDAEGLELRMLAHYMGKFDEGAYADTVVNGDKDLGTDVHTVNQRLLRMNSRNSAKTWIYAYLYGAGLLKLGMVLYEDFTPEQREAFNAKHEAGTVREKALKRIGLQARKRVEQGLPALGKLQEIVKKLAVRGYLKTIDGGRLKVRSAHSALNTLLQGGGAIVMKKAVVLLYQRLRDAGFEPDYLTGELRRGDEMMGFVANIHDEVQMEVPEHLAAWVGQLAADAIRDAGLAFGLRCPLAGAFQIGDNWADSH